MKPLMFGLKI